MHIQLEMARDGYPSLAANDMAKPDAEVVTKLAETCHDVLINDTCLGRLRSLTRLGKSTLLAPRWHFGCWQYCCIQMLQVFWTCFNLYLLALFQMFQGTYYGNASGKHSTFSSHSHCLTFLIFLPVSRQHCWELSDFAKPLKRWSFHSGRTLCGLGNLCPLKPFQWPLGPTRFNCSMVGWNKSRCPTHGPYPTWGFAMTAAVPTCQGAENFVTVRRS